MFTLCTVFLQILNFSNIERIFGVSFYEQKHRNTVTFDSSPRDLAFLVIIRYPWISKIQTAYSHKNCYWLETKRPATKSTQVQCFYCY